MQSKTRQNQGYFSFSFGCRVNQAEKEAIDLEMVKNGFYLDKNNPLIYIINTCAVTRKAEREARILIYQIRKKLPQTKIVITGCAATYWLKNNLFRDLPADLLVDNLNKNYLVDLIKNRLIRQSPYNLVGLPACLPTGKTGKAGCAVKDKYLQSGRALIKIQDGCHRFCTYCIVPYVRGLPRSVKIREIINKVNDAAKDGIKEVILTAINTEAYGRDTNETFLQLVRDVIKKTEMPRISFGSIHPWSLTDEFLDYYQTLGEQSTLVDFFHIPLQSGSNKILNLMKRNYTRREFETKLENLNRANPFALIATDVIVGFPDEAGRDFDDTYDFLKNSPIAKFHVFRFSKRQNTAAFYLSKTLREVSDKEKSKRAAALIGLGNKKYRRFLEKNVGRTTSALFIGQPKNGFQECLLDNQLPALVKTDKNLIGEIRMVKTERTREGKLIGKSIS